MFKLMCYFIALINATLSLIVSYRILLDDSFWNKFNNKVLVPVLKDRELDLGYKELLIAILLLVAINLFPIINVCLTCFLINLLIN